MTQILDRERVIFLDCNIGDWTEADAGDICASHEALREALRDLVVELGVRMPSDVGAANGSLEARAERAAWLTALAALSMTEEQAREASRGLWERGLAVSAAAGRSS